MTTAGDHWRPQACRLCGSSLGVLQKLGGDICSGLDCRRAAAREQALRVRDAELAARRASAARRWQAPLAATARVIWLERHETELVPVSRAARQAQQAHLTRLAAEVTANPAAPEGPPIDDDSATPLAGALCGFCGGRCCRYGATSHAFITPELLRRWLARHPGRTPDDAAAAYLGLLPRQHVARSCLHHGRQGCTLPAAMRSDICNRYACDGLRELQAAGAPEALVAAMQRDATLGDAALLRPEGFRRLSARRAAPPAPATRR
jgi:hypothetical protein